jgi:hypothetical protein
VLNRDFIELHNNSDLAVSLRGMSVQYGGALGTTWQVTTLPDVSVQAGGYFLIAEGGGGSPTASFLFDAEGILNMSATNGKVALVSNTTLLTGACPSGAAVIDMLGYGTTNCAEGSPAPSGPPTHSFQRKVCADTNDNAADFFSSSPTPQAEPTVAVVCQGPLNETDLAAEADFCKVQFPASLDPQTGLQTPLVYGRIFETGVTASSGAPTGVRAQLGYGPTGVDPRTQPGWSWFEASFASDTGDGDEFQGSFVTPAPGDWRYAYRFNLGEHGWTYCDLDGAGSNPGIDFSVSQLPQMLVP